MQVSCLVLPDGHVSTSLPWSPFSHALVLGCPILGGCLAKMRLVICFLPGCIGKSIRQRFGMSL